MTLAMSGVEPQDAGLASGLVNTTAQVGGGARPRDPGDAGLDALGRAARVRASAEAEALTGGYRLAFVVGLGFALGALVVAVVVIRPAGAPQDAPAPERAAEPEREPALSSS